jgi:nuclease S1
MIVARDRRISAAERSFIGFPANNLHHFWDIEFVERLGDDPAETAGRLSPQFQTNSAEPGRTVRPPIGRWSHSPSHAITPTACSPRRTLMASTSCRQPTWTLRTDDVAVQLSKAGVRLALLLNRVRAGAQAVRH